MECHHFKFCFIKLIFVSEYQCQRAYFKFLFFDFGTYVKGQYNAHTSLAYSPHHILIPISIATQQEFSRKTYHQIICITRSQITVLESFSSDELLKSEMQNHRNNLLYLPSPVLLHCMVQWSMIFFLSSAEIRLSLLRKFL